MVKSKYFDAMPDFLGFENLQKSLKTPTIVSPYLGFYQIEYLEN